MATDRELPPRQDAVRVHPRPENESHAPTDPRSAGTIAVEDLREAAGRLDAARSCELVRTQTNELDAIMRAADQLAWRLDGLRIALVAETISRGEHARQGFTLTDWVGRQWPSASRSQVLDLTNLGSALADLRTPQGQADAPAHAPVIEAVGSGAVSLRRASMVLRALRRVRPAADDDTYAEDSRILLQAAGREVFTENDLSRITDRLINLALSSRDQSDRDTFARAHRGINESSLADGTITRFIIHAEAEGAALIRSVLTSPLAAPGQAPADSDAAGSPATQSEAGCDDTAAPDHSRRQSPGTPLDTRSATQRRYDAFITMLGRGVAAPEGQPTTAKAQLMVTMSYDILAAALTDVAPVPGCYSPGSRVGGFTTGVTDTGHTLSPAVVRRLACDADIIPGVLGTEGEILDLGRTRRLVTPGQRRALAHRDRHCTYPGCSIPATWTDAHHIVHWADGGASDLSNYALLCRRHHTHVHDHHLSAMIDNQAGLGPVVTWDVPDGAWASRVEDPRDPLATSSDSGPPRP